MRTDDLGPQHIEQALKEAEQQLSIGNGTEAERQYQQILHLQPNQDMALQMLGVIAYQRGDNDIAFDLMGQSLAINPRNAFALVNYGNVALALGKSDEAMDCYQKAIALRPDFADAHFNLANVLHTAGRIDDAITSYQKAVDARPDHVNANYWLGKLLQISGKLDSAATSFQKTIALKPDHLAAYFNLGNVLIALRRLDEALLSYEAALALNPHLPEAHLNIGHILMDQGKWQKAVSHYHAALAIKPDYFEVWHDFGLAARTLRFVMPPASNIIEFCKKGLDPTARATTDFAVFEYGLDSFKPHEADESFRKGMAALPDKAGEKIPINGPDNDVGDAPSELPKQLVALLHFGRSGTGLLHSLIDGHPRISTLPSIYLRGYFNSGVWPEIAKGGWRDLPRRFADMFDVLFDARSPKPTPGRMGEASEYLGKDEGMDKVGENREVSLSLDRDLFCAEAHRLMQSLDFVDPMSFFMIVHAAYERVMQSGSQKHTVFYHIHNPDDFAKFNLLRYAPSAKLIMMIREPIENCKSWSRIPFKKNNYDQLIHQIISMFLAFDQVAFRLHDSIGVRLEDLKERPEVTIRSLSTWLGVQETPSLYEMTMQGEKWWGDPTSPDFSRGQPMPAFGKLPDRQYSIEIFSERDQFVLRTLFHPFSVRFGYAKPDAAGFEQGLNAIRPLLDQMFDFERTMAERSNTDPGQFMQSSAFLLFRACLVDRWDVLNSFKDYPHMLTPLKVD